MQKYLTIIVMKQLKIYILKNKKKKEKIQNINYLSYPKNFRNMNNGKKIKKIFQSLIILTTLMKKEKKIL